MKQQNWMIRQLGISAALLTLNASAADQNMEAQYSGSTAAMTKPQSEPVLIAERFADAFSRRADSVFVDRLHAFNMVKWTLQLNEPDRDDFRERTTSAAQNAFSKSVAYSARDAVAESPFMLWLEDRQGTLAAFLRDSIDSVEEESVSPLDASYGMVERSWWKNLRENEALRYGIRPFRSSPYAFTSFAARDAEQLFFLGHVRYYYDKLANHKFEIAASVPLAHGFALDVGTSYQFGRHNDRGRIAAKIFKELRTGGIAHLGFELRERPTLLAGVTFLW